MQKSTRHVEDSYELSETQLCEANALTSADYGECRRRPIVPFQRNESRAVVATDLFDKRPLDLSSANLLIIVIGWIKG
jgi:hypothetical protein